MKEKIAIIGGGNMGQAFAQGLIQKKILTSRQLFITNSKTHDNKEAVKKADIIILAVKPQILSSVLAEIKDILDDQLIVSIIAGSTIETIQKIIQKKSAIVRVMPNLAAKIGQSMSVWVKSKEVTSEHELVVKTILQAIGKELQLQTEDQINAATAISGSGPAYFFYMTELLEEEAIRLGFTREEASILARQTLLGSASLLNQTGRTSGELRQAVTSKGGTTEAALTVLTMNNFGDKFQKAIQAAFKRAREISKK